MKKLVCLAIALVMVLGLATCASAEFKFERKIDLVLSLIHISEPTRRS